MKKDPGEVLNSQMKQLLRNLTNWRSQLKTINNLLQSIEDSYQRDRKNGTFPDSIEYLDDDGFSLRREPGDKLALARKFEYRLMLQVSYFKHEPDKYPILEDPFPLPQTWDEFDDLRGSLNWLYKTLQNETDKARKKCVVDMIEVYAKKLSITVLQKNKVMPKSLKGEHYIVGFKYDYGKNILMGVEKSGKLIPAQNLKRK